MSEDGTTKDDVKVPEGEVGEKINKLFREEEKDTSEYKPMIRKSITDDHRCHCFDCYGRGSCHGCQGSSSWLSRPVHSTFDSSILNFAFVRI